MADGCVEIEEVDHWGTGTVSQIEEAEDVQVRRLPIGICRGRSPTCEGSLGVENVLEQGR